MSDRDGFAPGVPCFVAHVSGEPTKAAEFYSGLLDWETENLMPSEHPGDYFVCRLRGREVAAIVSQHGAPPPPEAVWTTLISVESADETAAKAGEAGGKTVGEPFDSPGGGRQAVLADPSGAVFSIWEPRERRGAQVVNEPGAWSMSDLNGTDLQVSKAFYGALFGWQTDTFDIGGAQATMWRLPGYVGGEPQQPVARDVIATSPPEDGGGMAPHWSVDFWVRDVEGTAARVAELGGNVIVEPFEIPAIGMRQAVIADPVGATLSLTQPPALG
jgi:predicted enzyme related to lactoylglutathione lyase